MKTARIILIYLAAVLAAAVCGVLFGATRVPLSEFVHDGALNPIVELRIVRTAAAAVVGASLAVSGLVFQAVLRNSLAEPFLLGVSGGAGVPHRGGDGRGRRGLHQRARRPLDGGAHQEDAREGRCGVKITIIISAEMIGTKLSIGVKGTGGEDFDLPTAAMAAMLKTHIDKAVRDFNPSLKDFMATALEAMAAARTEEAAKKERPQTPANPPEEEFCNLCDAMKKYADSLRADKKGGAE
jgi:hypothetical protein